MDYELFLDLKGVFLSKSLKREKIDIHHKTLGQALIPGEVSDRRVRHIIYHNENFQSFLGIKKFGGPMPKGCSKIWSNW